MKFAKRTLSLLLSVLLIVGVFAILPVSASAEDTITVFYTDSENWSSSNEIHVHAYNDGGNVTGDWPGYKMTYLYTNDVNGGQNVYYVTIPAGADHIIFNNNGNGSQSSTFDANIANGAWWWSNGYIDNVYFAASDSTCSAAGNTAYFKLDDNYYDLTLTATTAEAVVVPADAHTLITHKAVAAKYEVPGNIKYYECSECGKLFSDAEGTQEITLEQTVVPALPFASVDGVAYDNFLDAVAAANGEQIITLNAKVDDPYTLGADETLIVSD